MVNVMRTVLTISCLTLCGDCHVLLQDSDEQLALLGYCQGSAVLFLLLSQQ